MTKFEELCRAAQEHSGVRITLFGGPQLRIDLPNDAATERVLMILAGRDPFGDIEVAPDDAPRSTPDTVEIHPLEGRTIRKAIKSDGVVSLIFETEDGREANADFEADTEIEVTYKHTMVAKF